MALGCLMIDLEGTCLTQDERTLLLSEHVGGIILFSRNFESATQIQKLIEEVRAVKSQILVAVDHEGGRVWRFRKDFTPLPPMRRLGELYLQDSRAACSLAESAGWLMAAELLSVGVDFSFAPVLDLDWGTSTVIGDRAFSSSPDIVTELASSLMKGMHQAGMPTTGKHFPGHGYVQADSHTEVPSEERSLQAIMGADAKPFKKLAKNGLDAIMPAHVIYSNVDALPAGFSPFWLQTVLRKEFEFNGVIFSDDLTMEGATVAGSFEERAEKALQAGCDMVLVCNHREGAQAVLNWMIRHKIAPSQRLEAMHGHLKSSFELKTPHRLAALQSTDEWLKRKDSLAVSVGVS